MPKPPIRVLLVDDSHIALEILQRILSQAPDILVVGCAKDGIEALALLPQVNPDVICTDYHMPRMNGLQLTELVMMKYPRPILVISISVQTADARIIFKMLESGAVDVFPKPPSGLFEDYKKIQQELIERIRVLSGVSVFTRNKRNNLLSLEKQAPKKPAPPPPIVFAIAPDTKIVTIGASTGGPQALQTLLSQIPVGFPAPIVCVQHISRGFLMGLIDWLSSICHLPVKVAVQGTLPEAGTIYFAPEDRQLEFDELGRFLYSAAIPVDGHCPSVTMTFQSAARVYGARSIGILLTGMGRDGATGLLAIRKAGGVTIAQNESTSIVFGMPQVAIEIGAAQNVLAIQEIAPFLMNHILTTQTSSANSIW
jgi:two-component system chemotaxis response regulator CheB